MQCLSLFFQGYDTAYHILVCMCVHIHTHIAYQLAYISLVYVSL